MWRLPLLPSPDKSVQYSVAFQNKSLSLSPCPGWPTSASPTVETTTFTLLFSVESPRRRAPDADLVQELRPLVVPRHGWLLGADVGDLGGHLGDRRSRRGCREKADGLIGGRIPRPRRAGAQQLTVTLNSDLESAASWGFWPEPKWQSWVRARRPGPVAPPQGRKAPRHSWRQRTS